MESNTYDLKPRARQENLIMSEMAEEVLVYDRKSHQAHCLNRTAALIWKRCDGTKTVRQIAAEVEREAGASMPEEFIWLTLKQLDQSALLDERFVLPRTASGLTRREALKRAGLAAAIGLPLITSLIVPTAAEAAASLCVSIGQICGGSNPPCCSGLNCCNQANTFICRTNPCGP